MVNQRLKNVLKKNKRVFVGEKLSEVDETLLCLQAQLSSDEESQFHEVMSLAVRSTLEVLEQQLEPYLHGSLNNPSKYTSSRSSA